MLYVQKKTNKYQREADIKIQIASRLWQSENWVQWPALSIIKVS